MSILPASLAPVRAAVASVLCCPSHLGQLYEADDIAAAINEAAAVDNAPVISARVDTKMLYRAFANAIDEFTLAYDEYFNRPGDGNLLHVRRVAKTGRKAGGKVWTA